MNIIIDKACDILIGPSIRLSVLSPSIIALANEYIIKYKYVIWPLNFLFLDTTVSIIYKGEKRSFIGLKLNSTHEVNEEQIEELDKNNVEVGELYPKIPTIEELGIKGW